MPNYLSTTGNIIGLAASHIGCGVCTLFEGINYLRKKAFGSTYHYQQQFLPSAEHYKRKFTKQLEDSYKNKNGHTSSIGKAEIILSKAASYILGLTGLVIFVALATPKLGVIGGIFLGPTLITTAGYHIYRGAQSFGSLIGTKSQIQKRGEEHYQAILKAAQQAVDAGEMARPGAHHSEREAARHSPSPNRAPHRRQ